jgi:chromate transporter
MMTVRDKAVKIIEIFTVFLKLGLTSFGGPIAHLGYFRDEFVERRKWLNEHAYADLVALCQFLPGPASSQVGMAIGLSRAGIPGALAAWLGFTMPSAIALILFAFGLHAFGGENNTGWIHGLKIAAVAVVAQAIWGMSRTLTPDRIRIAMALVAAALVLFIPSLWGQIGVIIMGGLAGYFLLKKIDAPPHVEIFVPVSRKTGLVFLGLFFTLLTGLPFLAAGSSSHGIDLFDNFYRAGALVFGGGHVVLPLLQAGVVPPGWISNDTFLAGYGAAQAVPGPLFTFAAYLGAVMGPQPNGWIGALLCLVAIFLPSFLLIVGALPFWESLRKFHAIQSSLRGVNAAVVGILLAALYNPVWISGITSLGDLALGIAAFLMLTLWKVPPWLVVVLCAFGGYGLAMAHNFQ